MPRRDSFWKPLPQKREPYFKTVFRKMKGQVDFGRAKLWPILSIDAEGHFPLEALPVKMRDMELILTVKKSPFLLEIDFSND